MSRLTVRGAAAAAGLVRRSHCDGRGRRVLHAPYTKVGTTIPPRGRRPPGPLPTPLRLVILPARATATATATTLLRRLAGAACLAILAACQGSDAAATPGAGLTESERREIAETVERRLREATDLQAGGDTYARLMSLYPDSGRVVSASVGQVSTTHDSLAMSVRAFWEVVGQNMVNPEWRWGPMQVDVLGRDAAVVTATYRVPHLTPTQRPHVIGGAWTAVFARRGGRWVVVQEHLSDHPGPMSPNP